MKPCLAIAMLAGFLSACGKAPVTAADERPGIDARVSYPSSAAYEAETRSLLVASYGDGSIRRAPLSAHLKTRDLPPLPQDGRSHVFRVRVDAARARLWVLASSAVYLYDLRTSGLLTRIPIDEISQHSSEHCLPDMAIDGGGNVFVSSAMQPRLMRIDVATFDVTDRMLRANAESGKDFGVSALAFAADGATLYGASATIGTLWKIDHERSTAEKIEISQPIHGACALQAARAEPSGRRGGAGESLYVAGGFRNGIKKIELSGLSPYRVVAVSAKGTLSVPTDLVATERGMLIVSSRLSDHPDFDGHGLRTASSSILPVYTP